MSNQHLLNENFTNGFFYDFLNFISFVVLLIIASGIILLSVNKMTINFITRRKIDRETDYNEWRLLERTLRSIISTHFPIHTCVKVYQVVPHLHDRQVQLLFRYYHHEQNRRHFAQFSLLSPSKGDSVLTDIGLQI